jgi:hypothetical protein
MADESKGISRFRGQQLTAIIRRKATGLNSLAQSLERDRSLSARAAHNHILVYHVRCLEWVTEVLSEYNGIERSNEGKADPDFEVGDDDSWDLEAGTDTRDATYDTTTGGRRQCRKEWHQSVSLHVSFARLLHLEMDEWDHHTGQYGHAGVYPPEDVNGQPSCVSVFEGSHLEDGGEGDGYAAEAGCFDGFVPQLV